MWYLAQKADNSRNFGEIWDSKMKYDKYRKNLLKKGQEKIHNDIKKGAERNMGSNLVIA